MSSERRASARMAGGMNCDGGFSNLSDPSANLMAISQELAAERYSSVEIEDKRLLACLLSFSGAPLLQRKTLVSSKYLTIFFLRFLRGPVFPQRRPGYRPGEARRNHPKWSSALGRHRACAWSPQWGWALSALPAHHDWKW